MFYSGLFKKLHVNLHKEKGLIYNTKTLQHYEIKNLTNRSVLVSCEHTTLDTADRTCLKAFPHISPALGENTQILLLNLSALIVPMVRTKQF